MGAEPSLTYWVFGYSSARPLPEVWSITIDGNVSPEPSLLQGENDFGIRWAGETEALDRLILGRSLAIVGSAVKNGLDESSAIDMLSKMAPDIFECLVMSAMPIQDAIDLARYLVETTIGFFKFSIARARTVGGQIEIATITKHEGFRWVDRKHFYPADLNS